MHARTSQRREREASLQASVESLHAKRERALKSRRDYLDEFHERQTDLQQLRISQARAVAPVAVRTTSCSAAGLTVTFGPAQPVVLSPALSPHA